MKSDFFINGKACIGRGIALAVAQAGADVLIQYRSSKHLAEKKIAK